MLNGLYGLIFGAESNITADTDQLTGPNLTQKKVNEDGEWCLVDGNLLNF